MVEELDKFYQLQDPRDLWNLAKQTTSVMSNEDLLSRGKDYEQKLQEAILASTFALGFQKHISPVQIRMARVHAPLLDFEMVSQDDTIFKFEIVMAVLPERKLREEYQDGKRPKISPRAFSAEPADPERIASVIRNKTERARRIDWFNGHLLVYQNIPGGGPDLERLKKLISDSESIWQSIWLIVGVPDLAGMVLLCNSYGFPCAERDWLLINE